MQPLTEPEREQNKGFWWWWFMPADCCFKSGNHLSQVVLNMDHPLKRRTQTLIETCPPMLNHEGFQLLWVVFFLPTFYIFIDVPLGFSFLLFTFSLFSFWFCLLIPSWDPMGSFLSPVSGSFLDMVGYYRRSPQPRGGDLSEVIFWEWGLPSYLAGARP